MLPWAQPKFFGNEEEFLIDALQSSWISGGPYVGKLEDLMGQFLGAKHCVAVSSGTTALHAAYNALDLKPGQEVILPAFAYMGVNP